MITTASGLQYEVLSEGSGPRPGATDKVTVHYEGTLTTIPAILGHGAAGAGGVIPPNATLTFEVELLKIN